MGRMDDFLSEKVQEHGIARFGKKERACNRLDYRLLLADRVGFEPTSRLRDYLISRFYSNPPKTGSFRPFKTIVEKFVNAKIMLFSLFLPVGKNSGKNKIRRILI